MPSAALRKPAALRPARSVSAAQNASSVSFPPSRHTPPSTAQTDEAITGRNHRVDGRFVTRKIPTAASSSTVSAVNIAVLSQRRM